MADSKILQLIPATGWFAVYSTQDAPYYEIRRLLSFALMEGAAGKTGIDAIDQDMIACLGSRRMDEEHRWKLPHFERFCHETQITPEYKDRAAALGKDRAAAPKRG